MPPEDIDQDQPDSAKVSRPSEKDEEPPKTWISALIDAYKNEQKTNRSQEEREDTSKKRREIWTLVFIILTTVGVFVQACILRNTDEAMHESATAALKAAKSAEATADAALKQATLIEKQSAAIERTSTAGRAYILVSYDTPQGPEATGRVIPIRFTIKNIGQSPAIITSIDTHLFIKPMGGFQGTEPPDPNDETVSVYGERGKDIMMTPLGDFTYDSSLGSRPIIPGLTDIKSITQNFKYGYDPEAAPAHGGWFYCRIIYFDIFGIERHTRYYVHLYGATAEYPQNQNWNKWD
jgi:hypothetical protein